MTKNGDIKQKYLGLKYSVSIRRSIRRWGHSERIELMKIGVGGDT